MASSTKPVLVDIDAWLAGLGLSIYREAFAANHIDGETLPLLTAADLQEIGVSSVGHRRRLLEAIGVLARHTQQPDDKESPQADPEPAVPHALAAGRAPVVERRQVTVMFCDLVGSTALSARLDPEDLHDLLAAYRACVSDVVERHRGFIAHYVGDGVLVYFGYPQAHEQDAERALRTGLAILHSLAQLAPIAGAVPQARIGIATGLVVVGHLVGTGPSQEVGIAGETPNLAARLQALAGTNEMVVAQSTRELVGDLFDCVEIGRFELKGLAAPVSAWRVVGERAIQSRYDALRSSWDRVPLIGRESELSRIDDRLRMARGGSGQVVLVVAEAGFGKSRLVEEAHRLAGGESRGRLVLQCSPDQRQTPFYPVIRQIEYAAGIATEDVPAVRRAKVEALLNRTGTLSAERLAVVSELLRIGGDASTPQTSQPGEARARILKTLLDLAEAAADRSDILIAEDIHWADPSTLEFLGLLVHAVRNLPALVIATTRPGGADAWENEPHVTVLRLDRLPPPELRRLVHNLTGPDRLSPQIVEQIVSRSDGVPLFAQELTRGILARGGGQNGAPTIPSTLTESLLARLDSLDNGRETAQLAAVIGREFPLDLLVAISPENPDEARSAIRRLLEAGIFVKRRSTFGEAASFNHALVRDAAYELLLRRERVRLHEKIARVIEQQFPDIAAAMPHLVAHHLTSAGIPAKAIDYWEQSGAAAARQSSPVEAVSHFQKAIELSKQLPLGPGRDERELAVRLRLIGPLIASRGYASPEVADAVEQMLDLHHRSGSTHPIVPALSLKWLAQLGGGDLDALYETALQIRGAAEKAAETDRLLAHRIVGSTLLFRGELTAAVNALTAFTQLYDPLRHDADLARIGVTNHAEVVMLCLAECYTLMGRFEEAERWRQGMFVHAEKRHHVPTLCQSLAFGGCWLAALTCNVEQLAFYAAELRKLVTRHDLALWRGHADLFSGLAEIDGGDLEAGFGVARRGIDALIAGSAYLLSTWCMLYAEACERSGRLAEALEFLAVAEQRIKAGERWLAAEFHRLRARLNWARGGEPSAIEADLDQALGIARQQEAGLFERRAQTDLERWRQTTSFAS